MIYIAIAVAFVAVLARDAYRARLKFEAAKVSSNHRLDGLTQAVQQMQDRSDQAIKLLAEDWAKKFRAMEAANEAMRKHIDSQVAGTIAQLPNTGRGFGR